MNSPFEGLNEIQLRQDKIDTSIRALHRAKWLVVLGTVATLAAVISW